MHRCTHPMPPDRWHPTEWVCSAVLPSGNFTDECMCHSPVDVDSERWAVALVSGTDSDCCIGAVVQTLVGTKRGQKRVCVRGHLLSGPNLYVSPKGERRCRACGALHAAAQYRKKHGGN